MAGTRATSHSTLEARRVDEMFLLAHTYSTVTRVYFSVGSAYTCHLLYSSSHLVLLYECVQGVLLGCIFGCNEESAVPFWGIFIVS
jgi:hypothetical protein